MVHGGTVCRPRQLVDERFGAIVTTEGRNDGGLTLNVEPIGGSIQLTCSKGTRVHPHGRALARAVDEVASTKNQEPRIFCIPTRME